MNNARTCSSKLSGNAHPVTTEEKVLKNPRTIRMKDWGQPQLAYEVWSAFEHYKTLIVIAHAWEN